MYSDCLMFRLNSNFGTYCPNQRSLCPALREWTKREAGPRKQESKFFPERVIRKIWHLPLSLLNGRWLVPAARTRGPDEEGAVRGVSKKAAWEGLPAPRLFHRGATSGSVLLNVSSWWGGSRWGGSWWGGSWWGGSWWWGGPRRGGVVQAPREPIMAEQDGADRRV